MIPLSCKAVIFDMDGVLWLSGEIHQEAYKRALGSLNMAMPPYVNIAGRRTDEVMQELVKDQKLAASLTHMKRQFAHKLMAENPPVAHDCQRILHMVSKNHRLAIATSAAATSLELFLDKSGSRALFEVSLNGQQIERAKPAPDIYLKALDLLQLPADACVAVEDSLSGIEACRQANIPCIALTGTHTFSELSQTSAVAVINRLDELC